MKQADAIHRLYDLSVAGRYVFSTQDLKKIFFESNLRAFEAGLSRLVSHQILERVAYGVYLFTLSTERKSAFTIERIAKTLRRGEYSYISLESALSEYGVISQIPLTYLTVMTTGRKGEFFTPYGTIEFVHTKRRGSDILRATNDVGRPLRLAKQATALRDLKRVGRNLHLVQPDEVNLNE